MSRRARRADSNDQRKDARSMSKKKTSRGVEVPRAQTSWLPLAGAALLVVAALAGIVWWRGRSAAPAASGLPREISVAEAAAKRQAGAFILDVREPDEWEALHIPGATLIPLGQLEQRLAEVPAGREVVVVCRSGNRSATGRDILLRAGYDQVTSMAGGMTEWNALGYDVTTGP
jgi:rhodanese-related sulfurtransferase